MTHVRRVAAIACAVVALAAAPRADAQAPPTATTREIQARVLEVEGQDLILDLGGDAGVAVGQRVELWRPMTIEHPVTRRRISERFLIGELELVQVRPNMTLARVLSTQRPPERGDVVRLVIAVAAPPAPAPPPPSGAAPAPIVTPPHAPPAAPPASGVEPATPDDGPEAEPPPVATAPEHDDGDEEEAVGPRWTAPRAITTAHVGEVREGAPVRIALEIADAKGAVLHVRGPRDASYVSVSMRPSGGLYWAADVPVDRVEAPRLDWFVEAVGVTGVSVAVLGDSAEPQRTDVRPPADEVLPASFRAEAAIWTDYADYNRLRGNDWAWQTEGELGLRLRDEGVRAVRSGFGIYRGQGGSVEELDVLGLEPRDVGLTYGWLEGEFAPTRMFAILPRVVVGLGDDGVTGGGQLLFRIGHDRETNLLLGGEALGTVGVRGIAQFELEAFPRFPILFRTEVTNQPAGADASVDDLEVGETASLGGADVGARGIAQLGFRVVDDLVVSARGSFQGRTIEHAGPGFGAGVSTSW